MNEEERKVIKKEKELGNEDEQELDEEETEARDEEYQKLLLKQRIDPALERRSSFTKQILIRVCDALQKQKRRSDDLAKRLQDACKCPSNPLLHLVHRSPDFLLILPSAMKRVLSE